MVLGRVIAAAQPVARLAVIASARLRARAMASSAVVSDPRFQKVQIRRDDTVSSVLPALTFLRPAVLFCSVLFCSLLRFGGALLLFRL